MEIKPHCILVLGSLISHLLVNAAPKPWAAPADTTVRASDPCRELIAGLISNSINVEPFLQVAACRLHSESGGRSPSQLAQTRSNPFDSILKSRLPDDANWYIRHLSQFRSRRDSARVVNMAYLVDAKNLKSPEVFRELAEDFLMLSDPYRAALAYLHLAERDSMQNGMVQYQLENLMRTLTAETPTTQILDSLTATFASTQAKSADILEMLCWEYQNYSCAYRNFMTSLSLRNPGPATILDRVNRLQTFGFFDNASAVLDKLAWRTLSQPWQTTARNLYLHIRFQLKDWHSIVADTTVTGEVRQKPLTEEEVFIVADAHLKLGDPEKALIYLKRLEDKSTTSLWAFRGRLLKAQSFLAQGKAQEAADVLKALKQDPKRQEGTGPILFWQGCLAVEGGHFAAAESLFVLASAYTGSEEAQRALEYRFYLMQDTGEARPHFFRGLIESPHDNPTRLQSMLRVSQSSPLWPHAQLEKAQILVQMGLVDSAEKVLDFTAHHSQDRLAGLHAEAKAAFLVEKFSGGRQAALARYEDLLIKYQQGVIPEFSRERIKALK